MSPKSINDFLIRMFVSVVILRKVHSASPLCSYSLLPSEFGGDSLDNKLALSPLVFTGRLTASSNPRGEDNYHFVSLRVLKVHRGRLSKRLRRTIRLQFALSCRQDLPEFNPRSSRRKYLFFVARIGPGNYTPLGRPEVLNRKSKRVLRKVLCKNCIETPTVKSIVLTPRRQLKEGGSLKLKCILSSPGVPRGRISWTRNSVQLSPNIRISIRHKRKRSVLRIQGLLQGDSGEYSCNAGNVIGSTSASKRIDVKSSNVVPPHKISKCPIASYCLNQGSCSFYEMIGELVCKCKEGFAGQRCQFKKAKIRLPFDENACGLYGHDYRLRDICAAWRKSPELTEMSLEEYREWIRVEKELLDLKAAKMEAEIEAFKKGSSGRRRRPH